MTRRRVLFIDAQNGAYISKEFNGDKHDFELFHSSDNCEKSWPDILSGFEGCTTVEQFKDACLQAEGYYHSCLDISSEPILPVPLSEEDDALRCDELNIITPTGIFTFTRGAVASEKQPLGGQNQSKHLRISKGKKDMGMNSYPFDDTAFYIDELTAALLIRGICYDTGEACECDMQADIDRPIEEFQRLAESKQIHMDFFDKEYLRSLAEELGEFDLCHCSEFCGNYKTSPIVESLVIGNSVSESCEDDYILWLPLDKSSTLIRAAYPSAEAIVEEIKSKLSVYLPDNFDYAAHICRITGTYFC